MMRTSKTIALCALVLAVAGGAWAELQNVEIGGSLRIRGNYYNMDSFADQSFIEQRTRLNVKGDFTSDVSVFIEMDSYDIWGEDFRSDYLRGADGRAASVDDVEMYQAYIEARNLWGTPLSLRVGRQELSLGSEWLVGVNNAASGFWGLSFDALRLTYATDMFSVDAIAAKLAEGLGDFGEDDVDFYAVYGSYLGIEDVTLDAYWMYVRDDGVFVAGSDIDLHTLGLRGSGTLGAFDFELEVAYQLGSVDDLPSACPAGFGTADTDYDALGVNSEFGYTFDVAWSPRPFVRFAYLDGGDPDHSIWSNDRDLPFNRLFSNFEYTEFIANTDESNLLYYAAGVGVSPTESVSLVLVAALFEADEKGPSTGFWFWKNTPDKTLGWEVGLYADYQYSEDLVFRAGYAHFFGDDGLEGNLTALNGLASWGGDDDDDYDYVFVEAEISF
ncbi:MAG: alginate export family protein [Candidatus Hydrogenedens sp.]|nr:alginate export family protein [Candidatus Hydrogenedentota bacterium]NLF56589.1 alginate export family protein [Candidatus Hydrogenedens sp.]